MYDTQKPIGRFTLSVIIGIPNNHNRYDVKTNSSIRPQGGTFDKDVESLRHKIDRFACIQFVLPERAAEFESYIHPFFTIFDSNRSSVWLAGLFPFLIHSLVG